MARVANKESHLVRDAPARHGVKVVDEQGGHVLLQAPQARDILEEEHAGHGDVHAEPWPEEGGGGGSWSPENHEFLYFLYEV